MIMTTPIRKEYLGDSVYADSANGNLVLTTENGMGPSNQIVLEPEVIRALVWYLARHEDALVPFNKLTPPATGG